MSDGVTILHGDCLDRLRELPDASVDAVVTDPPYGLEFMGKDWDSFAPKDRKNSSVWDGRRQAQSGWEADAAARSGKGGGGPSYKATHKGAKRCANCGKRAFSGSPCTCDDPQWVIEHRQEAPSAMIGFQNFSEAWAREAYRVLKPGGHLLAFAGSRTYHRLAVAVEDAGFEIRDQIMWLYGSGFPKSLDVSKAIDKAAGAEREVVGVTDRRVGPKGSRKVDGLCGSSTFRENPDNPGNLLTAPATDAARQWQGWGSQLKPSHEPIVVARKPLAGTIAENVQQFGTGALNIDACRVVSLTGKRPGDKTWESDQNLCISCADLAGSQASPSTQAIRASSVAENAGMSSIGMAAMSLPDTGRMDTGCSDGTRADDTSISLNTVECGKPLTDQSQVDTRSTIGTRTEETTNSATCISCGRPTIGRFTNGNITRGKSGSRQTPQEREPAAPLGRWPANCIHDGSDEVEAAFAAFGQRRSAGIYGNERNVSDGALFGKRTGGATFDDTGSASRFFFCAKASKSERDAGLGDMEPQTVARMATKNGTSGVASKAMERFSSVGRNTHPTVKPLALMRYLVRLVTPPAGVVLDPFLGSGTTALACKHEGFRCIGIEREPAYVEIAQRRVAVVVERRQQELAL